MYEVRRSERKPHNEDASQAKNVCPCPAPANLLIAIHLPSFMF